MADHVSADEFERRLVALCIGGDTGLPRKRRDLHIILASATLWMEPDGVYTEAEVNAALTSWLETCCPSLRVDPVTLRRELVDRVYLNRDDAGRNYSPGPGPRDVAFGPGVANVDPAEVIETALAERRARKMAHLAKQKE